MRVKIIHTCVISVLCLVSSGAVAQDTDSAFKTADTNNAVIEGRVTLPTGFAAERNIRITLRNSESTLSKFYSNSRGEFRIGNLSEGVYYVQAEVDDKSYSPVEVQIALGRGITMELTLELHENRSVRPLNPGYRVVSAAELSQQVPTEAKKEYEQGIKLVGKANISQAAAHFQRALSIYPEYLAARNDLGAQYLKLGRLDEAESLFRAVLDKDPKNFNAKFNLGLVRIERKDYLDAINQLNEAIAIDSGRPIARLWLGVSFLELADFASAERELTRALITGPTECVAAHYHLARIYLAQKDFEKAAKSVRSYLDEAPKGEYAKEASALEKKLDSELKRPSKPRK